MTLFKHSGDNLFNGLIIGIVTGLLVASSNISFIHTVVEFVTNLVPAQYHFQYIEYAVFALIFGILGYILDRK